jgi:hypothetical protein
VLHQDERAIRPPKGWKVSVTFEAVDQKLPWLQSPAASVAGTDTFRLRRPVHRHHPALSPGRATQVALWFGRGVTWETSVIGLSSVWSRWTSRIDFTTDGIETGNPTVGA